MIASSCGPEAAETTALAMAARTESCESEKGLSSSGIAASELRGERAKSWQERTTKLSARRHFVRRREFCSDSGDCRTDAESAGQCLRSG